MLRGALDLARPKLPKDSSTFGFSGPNTFRDAFGLCVATGELDVTDFALDSDLGVLALKGAWASP